MSGGPLMLLGACRASGLLAVMPRLVQAPLSAGKGSILPMLLLLFAGHALCDYPLQGQFLSEAKNQTKPIPGIPWYQALGAHALIHAGMVYLITGIYTFAVCEFVAHFWTDYSKSAMRLTFNQDQAIHYGCKVVWAALCVWGAP
jgi:Protein of unknown function (DUF3307)